ncbi:MAG: threonine--tRNA ligase [Eubacterium sp.]|nr:threonine--tRNA ligase [Eubacterium sp.]
MSDKDEKREYFLSVYRHSMAHVMAKAVMEIFGKENVQIAIGPQIDDGFYYDFMLPRTITNEDHKTIEDKMREILKRREDWTCKEVTKDEALEIFKDQKYKVELINDLPADEKITIYYTGDDFVDLCRGPHIANSQELMNVSYKVKSVSGSYWRGNEKNDQLQRIYMYCFPSKQEMKAHLDFVKEAMERDHKKIGPEQELFMFDESAPGMPYWLPRGFKMYNAILDFWRKLHDEYGYQEILAPVINHKNLWETSGHWGHYKENMFLVTNASSDEETGEEVIDTDIQYAIKPMNCPNAINVYKNGLHSYKELPLRYSETQVIHRREKSGELNGLFRVQMFHQDDDHTFLTEEMIEDEIGDIMDIAKYIYETFGLTYEAELSTRPDDFMGAPELWDAAEASLKRILDKKYGEGGYEINEGDGAFYGPKIDLKMKDCIGREWQMGTIQLDFQLPLNFDLRYVAADGTQKRPVMIHRAIFGSFERFIGILIENFKGVFPFWMSPYQVGIVPIRPEHNEYAKKVEKTLRKAGVRVEADYSDENMKTKIKGFKKYKEPYILILGDKEAEEGTVSVNVRGNKQMNGIKLDDFVNLCKIQIEEHTLDLIDSVQ